MCEPVSLGIAAGATVVGAGVSAYGAYRQGVEADKAARFNAAMMRRQAGEVQQIGSQEAGRIAAEGRKVDASMTAQNAAGGVSGATVEAQRAALAAQVAQDEIRARANAAREAWTLRVQAREAKRSGKAARTAGAIAAAGYGIGGAGQAAGYVGQATAAYKTNNTGGQ